MQATYTQFLFWAYICYTVYYEKKKVFNAFEKPGVK